MKFWSVIVFLNCLFFFPQNIKAQDNATDLDKITQLVAQSKMKYAPDSRSKVLKMSVLDSASRLVLVETTEEEAAKFLRQRAKSIDVQLKINVLPDSSVGDQRYGIVNLSVANLRMNQGHSSEMATQLLLGATVDILKHERGEYLVRTAEGYIAWVPTMSIHRVSERDVERWRKSNRVIFTDEVGECYSQPDPTSLRISDLVFGDILEFVDTVSNFVRVRYPDGREGFVPKTEVENFQTWANGGVLTAENILKSAKTMIGLPYLWGGTSVKGVDCSGFTKTSFFMNGVVIPRDASQQVLVGEPIEILDETQQLDSSLVMKNLKPGDLLFFAASKGENDHPRVTHVALYMGDGQFIQAAGLVRINSLFPSAENFDEYQFETIVAARRYIDVDDKQIVPVRQHRYYIN